ncbi:fungal-specific transcription factor domain-containing protein [Xylariaceae sp. FL0255]|nr:fungal-specific transcription factor domain-containing protein [Xylariaceae sp. FL0255]
MTAISSRPSVPKNDLSVQDFAEAEELPQNNDDIIMDSNGTEEWSEIHHPSLKKQKACLVEVGDKAPPVKANKVTRRRAAQACVECRGRKVRCDVIVGGPPCGNCTWNQKECVIQPSKRRRRPGAQAPQSHTEAPTQPISTAQPIPIASAPGTKQYGAYTSRPDSGNDVAVTDLMQHTTMPDLHYSSPSGHQEPASDSTHWPNSLIAPDQFAQQALASSLVSASPQVTNLGQANGPYLYNGLQRSEGLDQVSKTELSKSDQPTKSNLLHRRISSATLSSLATKPSSSSHTPSPPSLRSTQAPRRTSQIVDSVHEMSHACRALNSSNQSPTSQNISGTPTRRPSSARGLVHSTASSKQSPGPVPNFMMGDDRAAHLPSLPSFFRNLPENLAPEDADYLRAKGAFVLPDSGFQSALLCSYIEYVHPYMPLLDIHDFLRILDSQNGETRTSLFLYQAIMFAATAFVSADVLKKQGFPSRRAARQAFFSRARLLYDFDCESDRLLLVQGLLLMTYWYETPDDQKDTWHWMGVAISLAHTIGLHRNPASTPNSSAKRQRLSKRIWWCCFMRDRLIALGMRRPTRIAEDDFDVPMLSEEDFDIEVLPDELLALSPRCAIIHDVQAQRDLASMCVQKAKLCVCLSKVLKTQYSTLNRGNIQPDDTTNSTMMLFPKAQVNNTAILKHCDIELVKWQQSLPESCQYRRPTQLEMANGLKCLAVQRSLLHMVYHATVSALHRPRFMPSAMSKLQLPDHEQALSRIRVCNAAHQTTALMQELRRFHLEKYLPTTGITVLLPTIIMHMLDMGSRELHAKARATQGINICMQVLLRLREIYAAANYAVSFLTQVMGNVMSQPAVKKPQQAQQAFAPGSGGKDLRINGDHMNDSMAMPASMIYGPEASAMTINEVTPPPEPVDMGADSFAHYIDTDAIHEEPGISGGFVSPSAIEMQSPLLDMFDNTNPSSSGPNEYQASPASHSDDNDSETQQLPIEGMMGAQMDDDIFKDIDKFILWPEFENDNFDFDAFQGTLGDSSIAIAN